MTDGQPRARRSAAALLLVVACTAVGLLGAFALKDQCTRHDWDGYQYRRSCYNDVFALYSFRGLAREPVPYIHGDGVLANENEAGDLEYPAGTGLFIAGVAIGSGDGVTFFRQTALWLGVAALIAAVALWTLVDGWKRVLLFSLGPSLVLYAFHNWDLLAVMFLCLGLVAHRNRMDGTAGALLGLGAAAKVFPGLIVPALMLSRKREGRPIPWSMALAAAAAFAAVNLPFLLANPDGWLLPWSFQSTRLPNFETSWYMLLHWGSRAWPSDAWFGDTYGRVSGIASTALFAIGLGLLLWRARKTPPRPYALSFAVLVVFLLTAKVYSPQFALWLLPFMALLQLRWQAVTAFFLSDAAVWFAISWYFIAVDSGRDEVLAMTVMQALVVARYVVLAVLLRSAMRVEENVAAPA